MFPFFLFACYCVNLFLGILFTFWSLYKICSLFKICYFVNFFLRICLHFGAYELDMINTSQLQLIYFWIKKQKKTKLNPCSFTLSPAVFFVQGAWWLQPVVNFAGISDRVVNPPFSCFFSFLWNSVDFITTFYLILDTLW